VQAGVLIRGNLRTDRLKVFSSVCDKVQELFGDKYKVLMIEDPEAYLDGPSEGPSSSSRSSSSTARGSSANAAAQPEPRVAFQVCAGGLGASIHCGSAACLCWQMCSTVVDSLPCQGVAVVQGSQL
jgi:hypothetical protein